MWAVGLGALRIAGLPPEDCGDPTVPAMTAAVDEAVGWIVRAQEDDGSYVYLHPLDGTLETDEAYNIVRHAGVTMSLYQYAALAGDLPGDGAGGPGAAVALEAADRGLAYMEARLARGPGWSAFTSGGPPQLGASALLLAGLLQRRLATGDTVHDDLARRVGAFVLLLQEDDGAFLDRLDRRTGRPIPGVRSLYATGEAFWALTLLDAAFPGEGWRAPARAVSRYLATERDRVEDVDWGLWADQWAAYGLAEAGWTLDRDEIAYATRLSERFGLYARTESQRESNPLARLVRGGTASGSGLGVEAEALGSLWRLAGADDRLGELRPDLGDRLACTGGILAARQHGGREPLVRGAWFTDGVTRMDDQQHALSGLLAAVLAQAIDDDGGTDG